MSKPLHSQVVLLYFLYKLNLVKWSINFMIYLNKSCVRLILLFLLYCRSRSFRNFLQISSVKNNPIKTPAGPTLFAYKIISIYIMILAWMKPFFQIIHLFHINKAIIQLIILKNECKFKLFYFFPIQPLLFIKMYYFDCPFIFILKKWWALNIIKPPFQGMHEEYYF